MVTTLDHLSAGRAVLGIGGAWFETGHTAFGIEFGSGFGERLDVIFHLPAPYDEETLERFATEVRPNLG